MTATRDAFLAEVEAATIAAVAKLAPEAELDPQGLLDSILAVVPPPAGMALAEAEKLVLGMASAELDRQSEADEHEARQLETLCRLGHAHGMPADVPVVPWLIGHGLARMVDGKAELVPIGPRRAD